jgi:heme-degrading monooxygenase HmoA
VFARVARYEVPAERFETAVEAYRAATDELDGVSGFQGGYVFTAPEEGVIMSMTLWQSRAAMDESEVHAARLRREATDQVDGEVMSVQRFEVAVETVSSPSGLAATSEKTAGP